MSIKGFFQEGKWLRHFESAAIGLFLAASIFVLVPTFASTEDTVPVDSDISIQAFAYAMPDNGWAPLTVYFSAFGTDAAASITRYEWDLDGNGLFETDATANGGYASYTYTKPRDYTISLRVTGKNGNTSIAQTSVNVRHPASSSVDYWTIFDDSRIRRVDIKLTKQNWDSMWADPGEKLMVPADAVVFGRRIQNAGLSTKGNSTLWFPGDKKPLKLDINAYIPEQEYKNLKMLLFHNNFGDPSMLREKLSYDLMRFAGVAAGHVAYAEVWLDVVDDEDPPTYAGVYTMVERPDRKFLANRFGRENDGGSLYKADAWFEEGAADLAYYGEDIQYYPKPRGEIAYRLMYTDDYDYNDIIHLCQTIDGVEYDNPEEFAAALEEVFHVDSFLRYLAVIFTTLNFDQYPDTGNNYYIYSNPGTGKFEWIAWDMNNSWGNFGGGTDYPLFRTGPSIGPLQYAPLYEKIIEVEDYRRDYLAYVDLLLRHRYNEKYIGEQAWKFHAMIRPHLEKGNGDQMYFGDNAQSSLEEFDSSVEALIDLTRERSNYISEIIINSNQITDMDKEE